MAFLDSLTGAASKTAARNNSYAINQGLTQGTDALTGGLDRSMALLGTGPESNALVALGGAYNQSRNDVTGAGAQTQSYLGGIQDLYGGLTQSGQLATDARSDALGLNGADGNQRATQAFQGSLGYNAGLGTGLDSVLRSASARGNLAGGNTSQDLFNYGADYQNRQAGTYINNLTTAGQNYGTGVAGQASGLGLQGAASQSTGSALGNLAQTFGQGQAGLYSTASGQQAQGGQALAGLQTGAANSLVQNNSALAASQNQASSNLLGLFGGGAQLLASPVGANGATGTVGGKAFDFFSNLFK